MKAIRFIGILCLTILSLSACKKNDVKPEQDIQLDLDNLMGYYMVLKHYKYTQSHAVVHYITFPSRGRFNDEFRDQNRIAQYGQVAIRDNIIDLFNEANSIHRFKYEDGQLTSLLINPNVLEAKLIKRQFKNPYAGKTFIGKYYKQNGTVLHESFFYKFNEDGTKVSAGLNYPTIIRTSDKPLDYRGDAYIISPNADYKRYERFVYDGEKVYVTYDERGLNELYYGEFVELK